MTRSSLEMPVRFGFVVLGLAIAWQAVRFCQGQAPIPFLVRPSFDSLPLMSIFLSPLYYIAGIGLWLSAATLTLIVGQIISRWIAVGGKQLCVEIRESLAEEQRLARIESHRAKRRELRNKMRADKSGGDTVGALIIGALIGTLFF
ncbi:MAG: hypothetical protein KAX55_00275 [Propionivibrio sp.]|nr:hypothetical protein [Propionivibrio sp.]